MNFNSFSFLSFIFVSLIVFHFFLKSRVLPWILAAINIFFVMSFASSPFEALPLFAFVALGYALLYAVQSYPAARVLKIAVVLIIASFVYLKQYSAVSFVPFLGSPYIVVGLSYILFRVIHLLIDTHDKAIKEKISPLGYFNFTCFFLSFLSGPIQRYQDFTRQLKEDVPRDVLSDRDVYTAFSRIATGYLKIIFLAPFFFNNPHPQYLDYAYVYGKLHGKSPLILSGWYSFAMISYLFKLYMNFSGYMDIVIGLGRLFHMKLPENFNRPFSSSNFLDFWSRWHITLAEWFKFYVFNPFSKALMHKVNNPKLASYVGVAAYFFTFFLLGLWHGTTIMFFIYGLFLGLGVSVNKLYQVLMRDRLGKEKYQQLSSHPFYQHLAKGLTGSYFAVALTCFWMDVDKFLGLFGNAAGTVLLLGFLGLGVFLAVFMFFWDSLVNGLSVLRGKCAGVIESSFVRQCWLAVKVLLILYFILININPAPEFMYQAF